jgi:uncharacterized membrane protein YciS (DUF1049 family)
VRALLLLGAVLAIAVVAVLLATRNDAPVSMDLLVFAATDVPLWGVLLGALATGGALVAGVLSWPYLRLRLRVRSQARQITRLEQEVHGLRTLPLPDEETAAGQR